MALEISVDSTLAPLVDAIGEFSNQRIANIISSTLTAVAAEAQTAFKNHVNEVFDRPKPFTVNAVFVTRSTAETLTATVGFKEDGGAGTPAGIYLQAELYGGERNEKPFEKALTAKGILPNGWQVTPGRAAKIDAYGGQSPSEIIDILTLIKGDSESPIITKRREKLAAKRGFAPSKYFFVKPGDGSTLTPGVWRRGNEGHGGGIEKVMNFVQKTTYSQKFNMEDVVRRVLEEKFEDLFVHYAQASIDRLFAKKFG